MNVRRFWVSGIVLTATIALLPFSFHAERRLETATRVEGSQAEIVREELASRFRSPFVDRVVLVIEGLPPADSEQGGQALQTIVAGLREQPGVSGVVSYLELRDPIFLGRGGERLFSWDSRRPAVQSSRLFRSFTSWQARSKINCGAVIKR